jgi:hypothetical protein
MVKSKEQPVRQRENRIWIELEQPPKDMQDPSARKAFREKQCELANNMMRRLLSRADYEDGAQAASKFWWGERDARYCYGGVGGYTTLADNGTWMNLDYVGRPLTVAEDKACAPIWKG